MATLKSLVNTKLWDIPLDHEKIPEIDLYMDQILRLTEEKGVTKTMINNYSKERLLKPLKGKKYSKEQIIQILCIMNLKQVLQLGHIKDLMPQEEGKVDFLKVYDAWASENDRIAKAAAAFVEQEISCREDMSKEEAALATAMMLSSCCIYFTRLCEALAEDDAGQG